jgi:hypothetical protein
VDITSNTFFKYTETLQTLFIKEQSLSVVSPTYAEFLTLTLHSVIKVKIVLGKETRAEKRNVYCGIQKQLSISTLLGEGLSCEVGRKDIV